MAENVDGLKELLETKVGALRDLIATQFSEREKLHDSGQDAVTKQIDAMNTTNLASAKALEMRLDKLSDRITVIESTAAGHAQSWGTLFIVIGLIFSGMVAFGIYAAR